MTTTICQAEDFFSQKEIPSRHAQESITFSDSTESVASYRMQISLTILEKNQQKPKQFIQQKHLHQEVPQASNPKWRQENKGFPSHL